MGMERQQYPPGQKPVPISLENDSWLIKTGGIWAAATPWLNYTGTAPGSRFFTAAQKLRWALPGNLFFLEMISMIFETKFSLLYVSRYLQKLKLCHLSILASQFEKS